MHFGINGALQSTKCESLGHILGILIGKVRGKFSITFSKFVVRIHLGYLELHGSLELHCQLLQPAVTCSHLNLK